MTFITLIPFIAIVLFLLALLFHRRAISALGWLVFAVYPAFEAADYLTRGEYFDASIALVFLVFTVFFGVLIVTPRMAGAEEERLGFTITKIALITAVFYFPFALLPALGTALIALTTRITVATLTLFNVEVYMVYPASIYSTSSAFHLVYKPIEIILACTAIQSMVLFTGLAFGVSAPRNRQLKAFLVSVPTIYVLNVVRNVFVTAAYFGEWFGPPLQSFAIGHGVIARIFVMVSLIAVAYAVFVILPEALDVIEGFFRVVLMPRKAVQPEGGKGV
jgi:archaeosortase A (PGF-CTERM-specific)